MAKAEKISIQDRINVVLFVVIIIFTGIASIFTPKENFSNYEKRALAQFPNLSKQTLFSGNFFKDIDSYYKDHFILRINMTALEKEIKALFGVANDGIKLYASEPKIPSNKSIVLQHQIQTEERNIDNVQGMALETEIFEKPESIEQAQNYEQDNFQNIKSIIIYQNRAIQIFGGSKKLIKSYAELANKYQDLLSPDIKLYVMAIPVGSDFYLPEKIKKHVNREKNNIDELNANLNQSIIAVPAYDYLAQHTKEYIQFNTDHHWTSLGAYYAYQAFCKVANLTALSLEAFTKKEIPDFLGTLYYRTLNNDLKENADRVEYYKIPYDTEAYFYKGDNLKPTPGKTYVEFAKGSNAYGVFLGGDYPLMKIISAVKNNKKILVIKDSYGNAFVPYLSSHYEEVYIVDYRYFNGNIKKLMQENKINEILLAHNIMVMNSLYTIRRESAMLTRPLVNLKKITENNKSSRENINE